MKKVYIYGLVDPETKDVRYVGKSVNPKMRLRQHVGNQDMHNDHKRRWIVSLTQKGLKPNLIILEETDEEHWDTREKYWIKRGLKLGWPLVNISAGGACYPAPIESRQSWIDAIHNYLPPGEREQFAELSEEQQREICRLTAIEMMRYSWTAIRERGGDPKKEYSHDKQFWAGSAVARRLTAEATV